MARPAYTSALTKQHIASLPGIVAFSVVLGPLHGSYTQKQTYNSATRLVSRHTSPYKWTPAPGQRVNLVQGVLVGDGDPTRSRTASVDNTDHWGLPTLFSGTGCRRWCAGKRQVVGECRQWSFSDNIFIKCLLCHLE